VASRSRGRDAEGKGDGRALTETGDAGRKKNQTFFLSQALPGALDAEALKT